ncbi:hypothetical protein PV08_12055 [Exophiala spinifera]|uniref:NACHT domain-containing protein n=1 Tax=Exophiala spinifera TaxID=91928 RepID=A0A0D1Z9Q8_9EURO|nr:uncharacterized protein PV08_12055 [Exophiala spinifera]KIW09712.1 hypothetical protein PV08_12055 [Exophiala spinifera]
MAEAVAIIGLVSSIASLFELSVGIVSRLHDFTSKTSEVPESFRSLTIRLPLLTETLQRIQTQANSHRLPDDVTKALTAVVRNTSEQLLAIQTRLSKILPSDSASRLERALKALKSLAREDEIQQALEKIEKNISVLVLYQTTGHVDTGDLILAQLSELTMISKSASRSFGKDELLSLARATGKTILEELSPQTQSIISNSNRGLLFRFSQLPIAAQEKFIARQEKELRQFVEQEEAKVLEFLTGFDTRDRLADQGRRRAEGSCDWILESPDYLNWVGGNCNRLWLLGGPGSGKTVVSAFITEALNNGLRREDVLAVYACSFTDSQTTSATNILYALAAQIAQSSLACMEKCKRFLERHLSEGKLKAEIQDLQDLIVEMSLSTDIQRIFIVIDGLDEVEWEQPDHLMVIVDIPQYARKVKMLITSRPCPRVAKALQGYSTLSMNDVTFNDALAAFIDGELKRSRLANIPQHDFDELKESLIRTSNGMFLHAQMAISLLSESYQNVRTFQQTKEALLQDLPKTLEEVYNLKMLTIQANNSAIDATAVESYLRILAANPEMDPLTELHQAAIQECPDVPYYTPEDLAERAQGLLKWDPESRRLRFIHLSAIDYMLLHTR